MIGRGGVRGIGVAGGAVGLGVAIFLLFAVTVAQADVETAEAAWDRGDRAEAARLIRVWVRANPEGAHSLRAATLLARTAADPAEASTLWDEVIGLDPSGEMAAEAHWQKGMHAYSAGLYVAAGREFELLGREFADWFDPGRAFLWKAYSELGAENPEVALQSLREADRGASDPQDQASIRFALANAHFRLGNVSEAMRRYERFERDYGADGRASAAARSAVECLRLLGREKDASEAAVRIEQKYPDSFEATLARAEIRTLRDRKVSWKEGRAGMPPTGGPFVVQVAAMSDPRNAAALRRQILAMGISEIRVEPGDGPQGPVHRVLLGPYDDEPTARAIADSVAAIGDLNPRVREVESR